MAQQDVIFDPTLMDSLDVDATPIASEFDVDADYAAPAPPLPDGTYTMILSVAGVKDENGTLVPFRKRPWGNIPSTHHTSINARIVDPGGPQDGKFATDNTVTTHIDPKRHNTSKAAMYYRAITGKPIPGVTEGQHMKALLEALQGSPTVLGTTQLEGQAQDASKAFSDAKKANGGRAPEGMKAPKTFRGQKSFTQEGKLTGRVWDDEAQEFVVGRPTITGVKPVS